MTTTTRLTARERQILTALARAGIMPDDQTITALRSVADQLEAEMGGRLAADLIAALQDHHADAKGRCVTCGAETRLHIRKGRWVGCIGARHGA